ncbi:hypothetical protein QFZ89_000783 [Paraburkholderia youngii]
MSSRAHARTRQGNRHYGERIRLRSIGRGYCWSRVERTGGGAIARAGPRSGCHSRYEEPRGDVVPTRSCASDKKFCWENIRRRNDRTRQAVRSSAGSDSDRRRRGACGVGKSAGFVALVSIPFARRRHRQDVVEQGALSRIRTEPRLSGAALGRARKACRHRTAGRIALPVRAETRRQAQCAAWRERTRGARRHAAACTRSRDRDAGDARRNHRAGVDRRSRQQHPLHTVLSRRGRQHGQHVHRPQGVELAAGHRQHRDLRGRARSARDARTADAALRRGGRFRRHGQHRVQVGRQLQRVRDGRADGRPHGLAGGDRDAVRRQHSACRVPP